jgi:ATP-binding protein involved in chromosome partitioning
MSAMPSRPEPPKRAVVPGVARIIAISSGKGGVGKSTTAVNLALALVADGLKVGLMDADVHGPSVPKLLALSGRPEMLDGKTLRPMDAYGLKAMSIGLLVGEETPMIWRGPMVMSAITQMLRDVAWGELDVLVVDMPPGTGDAQLTLAQIVPLAGAVVVSTPQDLALIDARRGLAMFRRVDVPILGIVENMSFFLCPSCGTRADIFGHGGAREEAARVGVPFLGEVPLAPAIREGGDDGRPIMVSDPDGPHARAYRAIARAMLANAEGARKPPPRIVIE